MTRAGLAIALMGSCLVTSGCGTSGLWQRHFQDTLTGAKTFSETPLPPRELAMFDGRGGLALDWTDLMEAVRLADIVVVGEMHTDAAGHKVELAIVQDLLKRWPGSAASMEMLTREDQPAADDYIAKKIDEAELVKRTHTADWAGKGTWVKWYHPITAMARVAGGRLVAANAPRKYADLARKEGYDALRQLPEAERKLFDVPEYATRGAYYRRFCEVMREHVPAQRPAKQGGKGTGAMSGIENCKLTIFNFQSLGGMVPSASGSPAAPGKPNPAPQPEKPEATRAVPRRLTCAEIAAMFRSQQLWDATMAASVLRAYAVPGVPKVVHLVGGFHIDFDGGLVQRLRRGDPGLRILTISLQSVHSRRLRGEDRGRADVVIYTGVK